MFDNPAWLWMPFHFWSVVFFILGSIVGSLLNVCIHRMPRGESLITPGSHCPHCQAAIPWHLNIPVLTWVVLRGKCVKCGAPISPRYFAVEVLTGAAFLACWLVSGGWTPWLPLAYSILLAGFIVASFIDAEHLMIPDEITLGGVVVGLLCSVLVPQLHATAGRGYALFLSFDGIVIGAAAVYGVRWLGKLMFGRQKIPLEPNTKVLFLENGIELPDRFIPYEEIFLQKSDTVVVAAKSVEINGKSYANVTVRLSPERLQIGEEMFHPEAVSRMEVIADELVLPREVMGIGDVKLMAAIGAFLGWQATFFSLMMSAVLGSLFGVGAILIGKREWSSRLPYGPYICVAATIWIVGGKKYWDLWLASGGQ